MSSTGDEFEGVRESGESKLETYKYLPGVNLINFINESNKRGVGHALVDTVKFVGHSAYALVGVVYTASLTEMASKFF